MRSYRCYFLNQLGRIKKAEIVDAVSDERALLQAMTLINGQSTHSAIEVWEGERKVFPRARDRADIEELKRLLLGVGVVVEDQLPF